jgi:hypothetical protein
MIIVLAGDVAHQADWSVLVVFAGAGAAGNGAASVFGAAAGAAGAGAAPPQPQLASAQQPVPQALHDFTLKILLIKSARG